MERPRAVIHLHYLVDDTHHYYGSIAKLFDCYTSKELGITYGSLRNRGLTENKPFINDKCIIRKGVLLSKSGNRGKQK